MLPLNDNKTQLDQYTDLDEAQKKTTGVSEIGGEADPSFRYLIMPIRFGA